MEQRMATPTTWQIDPTHTSIGFAVKHLMISTVKGHFQTVRGTVRMSGEDPLGGSADVEIDVASISTGTPQRDDHLRSPDFFDAARFPVITFRSRRMERGPDGDFRLTGDLSIRDVTKEVALTVTYEGATADPWGGRRTGFSATGRIKRSDFGIVWNQLIEAGGVTVGDEIRLNLDVQLVKQEAAKAA
jgi:polyisoprenoid-binding protein YceI